MKSALIMKGVLSAMLVFMTPSLLAQTSWKGTSSTAWGTAANWTAGVPTAGVDAIIGDANFTGPNQPTISSVANCRSLTLGAGAISSTLTVSKGLTISGNVTVGANGKISHTVNTAISVKGNWTNSGSYAGTRTGSGVTFSGTTQFIGGSTATGFRKLTINAGSVTTLGSNISVTNSMSVSGTLDPGTGSGLVISGAGTLSVANGGKILVRSGTFAGNYALAGTKTLSAGSTVDYAAAGDQTVASTLTYSTLRVSGSGIKTLAGNLPALVSSVATAGNIDVAAATLNLSTFTANRGTTVAGGTISVAAGAFLKIGGTGTFPANYATPSFASTSTVEYNGTNQTVATNAYGHLTLSGSSGAVTKTMPVSAMTVAGNFTANLGAATSVTFTAGAALTVNGNVLLGAGTTFNGGSFTHIIGGNWTNNGTFTGGTSTVSLNGVNTVMFGAGTNNFFNLTLTGSGITAAADASLNMAGDFSTSGAGTFTHIAGGAGALTMSGTGKTMSGSGIVFSKLVVSGSASSAASYTVADDLVVNGSLTNSAGTITLSGAGKRIYGAGAIALNALAVPGGITTTNDFSLTGNLNVSGSFTATAGMLTFAGTTTVSGTASLFNSTLNGTLLQMGADSVLRLAGTTTLLAGTFDVTNQLPNTIVYNSAGSQWVFPITYYHLEIAPGGTKTVAGNVSVLGNLMIDSGAVFSGGAGGYTNYVRGNWLNYGTYTAGNSTVEMVGPADSMITGATTFNQLRVNKNTANLLVNLVTNSQTVATLGMALGTLNTGTNTLTITATRTGNGHVVGTITRQHSFSAGVDYAFEGPFTTVNFASLTGVSSVTMTATGGSVSDFPSGAAISRQYTISLVSGGAYEATLRAYYRDAELNGNDEATMALWQNGGSLWVLAGKTGNDTVNNWVEQSSITNLTGRWTMAGDSGVVRWNGSVSTAWETPANWTVVSGSPSRPPDTNDIAELGTASATYQPAVTTAVAVKSLSFGSAQAMTLTMSPGATLTAVGIQAIGNVGGIWTNDIDHTINVGAQTLTVGGDLTLSDGNTNRTINLIIDTGTVNVGNNLVQSGGANITFTGAGTLNLGGDFNYVSGTFTAGPGTVNYTGSEAQVVAGITYNELVFDKSDGVATLAAPATVNGNLTLTNGGGFSLNAPIAVAGNVTLRTNTTLNLNNQSISLGGNWVCAGATLDIADGGEVVLNGTGEQTIFGACTFHDLDIRKPSGTVTLADNISVALDLDLAGGNLDLSTHTITAAGFGAVVTAAAGTTLRTPGSFPIGFNTILLDPASTVEYYGSGSQTVAAAAYGQLIVTNGNSNAKTLAGPITVGGNMIICSNATLAASSNSLTLYGNWTNNGTFSGGTGTLILSGTNKIISGNTTLNHLTVVGSYTSVPGLTLYITGNTTILGSFAGGNGNTTMEGDFLNQGSASSSGTLTFAGTRLQTLRVLNAIQSTSGGIVNFNGTVAPVLNSTTSPTFANVNINNTAGIVAGSGWTVFGRFNVNAASSFNGGNFTHTFRGSVTNNGTMTGSGTFNFNPLAATTLELGGHFSSQGVAIFSGANRITISSGALTLGSVEIANTHAAGITPVSNWTLAGDLQVDTGVVFHAGAGFTHTIAGDLNNNGTFDGGTSLTVFNGTGAITGGGSTIFNHLLVSGSLTGLADISVAGSFTNNGAFDSTGVDVIFAGGAPSFIAGTTAPTGIDSLVIAKSSATNTVTLAVNIANLTSLAISSGILDTAAYTVSEDAVNTGALSVNAGSTLRLGGGSTFPTFTGGVTLNPGSTVEYSGGAQTVAVRNYVNLKLSGTGNKTLSSAITNTGNVDISGTAKFNLTNGKNSTAASLSYAGVLQPQNNTYGSTSSSAAVKTDTYFQGNGMLTVGSILMDHFAVTVTGTPTAKSPFTIAITAQDANDNTVPTFTNLVSMTETGGGAGGTVSPTNSGYFAAGVLASQSVTLSKAGALVTISVTGTNAGTNYTGVSDPFTVNPATPDLSWATPTNIVYGTALGTNQNNATSSLVGTFVYNPTNGTVLRTGTNTLSVTFTPTNTDYSNRTMTVSLVVTPAPLGITANSTNRIYGMANPAFAYTASGFVNGDTVSVLTGAPVLTTSATTNSPVGSYVITNAPGTLTATNYTLSFTNGTLTVNPRPVALTGRRAYDGTTNVAYSLLTVTNAVNGDSLTLASGTVGLANPNVGVRAITSLGTLTLGGAQATNYTVTNATGSVTITNAPLTITANNDSKIYGSVKTYGAGSTAFTSSGLQNGETIGTVTITANGGTLANSPAGNYLLTPSAATGGTFASTNYSIAYVNGMLTVIPLNVAPSFTKGTNVVVAMNASAQSLAGWATNISPGPTNESSQTLTFNVSSDNSVLFSVPPAIATNGTLTFTPATGLGGIATVTVNLQDNGGTVNGGVDTSANQTFTILIEAYSIGNRVFFDMNNNGAWDYADNGVGGARVLLFTNAAGNPAGSILAATNTDSSGDYRFDNLAPGSYVTVVDAASASNLTGYAGSTGYSTNLTLTGQFRDHGLDTPITIPGQVTNGIAAVPMTVGYGLQPTNEVVGNAPGMGRNGPCGDAYDNLVLDFGFTPTYSIGNRVFADNGAGGGTANNGIQDGTEPGIASVAVKLFAADGSGNPTGATLASTNTDANGYYRFDGLVAATYIVVVDQANSANLAGLVTSTAASTDLTAAGDAKDHGKDATVTVSGFVTNGIASPAVTLGVGLQPTGEATASGAGANGPNGDAGDNLAVDFGFTPAYSIGNRVFLDDGSGGGTANNGIQDGTEPGIANVNLHLYAADMSGNPTGSILAHTATDSDGHYRFDAVPAGTFVVVVHLLDSSAALNGLQASAVVSTDNTLTGDAHNHGQTTPLGAGSVLPGGIAGNAITVGASAQPTGEATGAGAGANGPTGDAGDNLAMDFGFAPSSDFFFVGNRVFLDDGSGGGHANNGIQDGTEPGIANVAVKLFAADGSGHPTGSALATTNTDASGYYFFDDLPPGNYVVVVDAAVSATELSGLQSSHGVSAVFTAGSDRKDHGLDTPVTVPGAVTNGIASPVFTLGTGLQPVSETDTNSTGAGAHDPTGDANDNLVVDFGFAPTTDFLNITNRVFLDNGLGGGGENNGVQDGSEAGVSNVVLMLFAADGGGQPTGSALASQTTDAGGESLFSGVAPGSYVVVVDAANSSGLATLVSSSTNATSGVTVPGAVTNGVAGAAVTVGSGTNGTSVFGFAPTYSIGNRIFRDPDNDAQPDLDMLQEGGLYPVRLLLFAADGNGAPAGSALAVITNDVEGFYRFDDLVAGTYVVVVDQAVSPALAHYECVTRVNHDISYSGDLYNHGIAAPVTVGGVTNGIASVPVTVGLGLQPLGEATAPDQGANGPAGDANDNLTLDFGFHPLHSIGNRVFLDNGAGGGTANNGIQDGTEPGIADVVVKLFAADISGHPTGAEVASTNTDAAGYYRFDGVRMGELVVVVDQGNSPGLAGFVSSVGVSADLDVTGDRMDHGFDTPVTVGAVVNGIAASAINLDQMPPFGEPDTNGVAAGAHGPNGDDSDMLVVDFGFVPAASVAGSVLNDATSVGVDGVSVALRTPAGATLATTVTSGGGHYQFTNLAPASYLISETHLPNWVNVTSRRLSITLAAGENSTGNDFRDLPFVNVAPTMNPLSDIHRVADWSPQTINLTGISAGPNSGPTNETSQTVSITAFSDNPALLPGLTVNYTAPDNYGTLTLTPGNNVHVYGTATITVILRDDGGTANGGTNVSAYTFTFTEVAPLVITANDDLKAFGLTKTYGPGQTAFTTTGLIPGDTVGSVTITASGGTNTLDDVGDYILMPSAVTGGTFNLANYSISYTPGTLRVVSAETALSLTSSLNPSGYREAVIFTATLPGTNATGTVVFAANGTAFSTNTVAAGSAESAALTNLLRGVSVITAVYSGDGSYLAATNTLEQSVTNHPPSLAAIADQSVDELTTMTVATAVTDPDGGPMTYELLAAPTGAAIDENGVITWTPTGAQGPSTNLITVSVTDDGAPGLSVTGSFTVVVIEPNSPPSLTVPADQTVVELTTLTVTNTATDNESATNELVFALVAAPNGMSLNPTNGVITWTPTETQGPATNVVRVKVTDAGTPPLSATNSFTVIVTETNAAPVLTVPADQIVAPGANLAVNASATDSDRPVNTLLFSLVAAPGGMTINAGSGAIAWLPTIAQRPGTNTVVVRVTDNGTPNLSDEKSFTVTTLPVPDTNAPVLKIKSLLVQQNYTNTWVLGKLMQTTLTNIVIQGTATDNQLVAQVSYAVTNGGSGLATGTSNWTAVVPLPPGTNTVTFTAADRAGNVSKPVNVVILRIVDALLTINIHGSGTVTPALTNTYLHVGSPYSIRANAAQNWVLTNWSGDIASTSNTVTFLMPSNGMTLNVNFMTNPFIAAKGIYQGLFSDSAGVAYESCGYLICSLTTAGKISGSLSVEGWKYPIVGSVNQAGQTALLVKRPGKSALSLELQLTDLYGAGQHLAGTVSCPEWSADLTGLRTATNAAADAGNYNILIPGCSSPEDGPSGFGFGTATLSSNGGVKLKGTTADNVALNQSVSLSVGGSWPLYVPLYPDYFSYLNPYWTTSRQTYGVMIGWLSFTNRSLTGEITWIKKPLTNQVYYASGFTNQSEVIASTYLAPVSGRMINLSNCLVQLSGGDLAEPTNCFVTLKTNNIFSASVELPSLKLQATPRTGTVKGSFLLPGTTNAVKINALTLPEAGVIGGFFTGFGVTGQLLLQ